MTIAILGGTGKEGSGLALRWASAGRDVVLGSRDESRGRESASTLSEKLEGGAGAIRGTTNRAAADEGDVVVSTLPHPSHLETLAELRDVIGTKLFLTATIVWPPGLTERPSAAEQARDVLGDGAKVVAAFQTVSAHTLRELDPSHEEDVLICSDDEDARERARELVDLTGLRGVVAGPLAQARVAEALTGLLLKVNRRYKVTASGIRFTGIETGSSG